VYLEVNGVDTHDDDEADDELIALTLAVAEGQADRARVAETLERRFGKR
jgi:hypothetical protein